MMNSALQLAVLASSTVAEFKAFKRAVRVLCMSGVHYDAAVDILLTARLKRDDERRERRDKCFG